MKKFKIFLSSVIQVNMVAMNVVFITNRMVIPMLITGFLISLIWTFNIKKIVAGNMSESIIYALGAMVGTGIGYYAAHILKNIINGL